MLVCVLLFLLIKKKPTPLSNSFKSIHVFQTVIWLAAGDQLSTGQDYCCLAPRDRNVRNLKTVPWVQNCFIFLVTGCPSLSAGVPFLEPLQEPKSVGYSN